MITICGNDTLLGDIIMRELKDIENEIVEHQKKGRELLQERREIKRMLAKRNSAISVLENIGWKFEDGKWNKPAAKVVAKPFSQTPLVAGGFATWDNKILGGNVYVRTVGPWISRVSWVSNVTLKGAHVSEQSFNVSTCELIPRDRTYFIGK